MAGIDNCNDCFLFQACASHIDRFTEDTPLAPASQIKSHWNVLQACRVQSSDHCAGNGTAPEYLHTFGRQLMKFVISSFPNRAKKKLRITP